MISKKLIFIVCVLFNHYLGLAQKQVLYKQIDTTKLFLEIYNPPQFDNSKMYPAMVFFFGGGWIGGDKSHFLNHAKYFSKRGIVCFLSDYRTRTKNKTTPFESLKDAKSAIRFIRKNASNFGVDPTEIIASSARICRDRPCIEPCGNVSADPSCL